EQEEKKMGAGTDKVIAHQDPALRCADRCELAAAAGDVTKAMPAARMSVGPCMRDLLLLSQFWPWTSRQSIKSLMHAAGKARKITHCCKIDHP
ncbi:MAG: hypothetical protein CMJ32_07715, partial [Phycisphaerae bacterium]|nr:hypothetical protein [Phycisphaerae bacterium]